MPTQGPLYTPVFGALALAAALSVGGSTPAQAAHPEGRPVAVSPGDATKVAVVEGRCPTFSWGEVEGAKSYDLVVYRLGEQDEHEEPVLQRSFPGSVDGWTPALDQCLERGGRYAWSVRALGGEEASEWSELSLFQVASGPSEEEFESAVEVVRQYLKQEDTGRTASGPSSASAPVTAVPPTAGIVGPPPSSLAGAGDADLQVNGSPVLTEATLGTSCFGRRWLDQGDGTVLDCNTRLIWLKDASCLGAGTWGALFTPGTVQFSVLLLNIGSIGCTDYTAGTYNDWRIPTISELCSDGALFLVGPSCPVANYATSLVDNRFGGDPRISNGAGDGAWSEGDPFRDVIQSGTYWSSTPCGGSCAHFVSLDDGHYGAHGSTGPDGASFWVWPVRSGQ